MKNAREIKKTAFGGLLGLKISLSLTRAFGFAFYDGKGFFSGVDDVVGKEDFFFDEAVGFINVFFEPENEISPVFFTYENYGNIRINFLVLNKIGDFKEFVQSAKAAWKVNVGFGGIGEHDFSGEEIVEADAVLDVRINFLLEGKLDVETDRFAFGTFVFI